MGMGYGGGLVGKVSCKDSWVPLCIHLSKYTLKRSVPMGASIVWYLSTL